MKIDCHRLPHYIQFLGGGVVCATLNNAILIVGDWLGYGYVSLILTGYMASITVGYVYHCCITFDKPMTLQGYTRFSAGIWLGLPLSFVVLLALGELLHLHMWIAAPTMTCVMLVYHYATARIAIGGCARQC